MERIVQELHCSALTPFCFFRRNPGDKKGIHIGQWKRNESPTEARIRVLKLLISKSSKPCCFSKIWKSRSLVLVEVDTGMKE